ncbi:hypothetical protein GNF51_14790, partial [Clostridium perfringens]|nr:hypothetical protein [Clostridium perfringens]
MLYLSELNAQISFELNYEELWSQEDIETFQDQFYKYLKAYKQMRKIQNFKAINVEIENMLRSINKTCLGSHCSAGESSFTVTQDGDIYPCSRFVASNEGNLWSIY